MRRGRQRGEETSIPYYQLRHTVELGYGRRRMIRRNIWWGVGTGLLIMAAYIWTVMSGSSILGLTPIPLWGNPWYAAPVIAAISGLTIWVFWVLIGLLLEQVDYTPKEAFLAEECIAEIERERYNNPPTLEALRASASGAGEAVQIRTPLPLAIIGAMVAIFTLEVPGMLKFLVGEVGMAMLLYLVLVSGHANADMIIRNAIIEFERRLQVKQAAASLAPTALLSTLLQDSTAHSIAEPPNGAAEPATKR